jgi:RimJ/RimL family protein N-acetyltransferase
MVELNPLDAYQLAQTLDWMQDEQLRYDFHYTQKPTLTSHFGEWHTILTDQTQRAFAIQIKGNGTHIGNAGVKNISRNSSELWLYIAPPHKRKRGYGENTLALLESFIKNDLHSERAVLHVRHDNAPAIALYKKVDYDRMPWDGYDHTGFSEENLMFMGKVL